MVSGLLLNTLLADCSSYRWLCLHFWPCLLLFIREIIRKVWCLWLTHRLLLVLRRLPIQTVPTNLNLHQLAGPCLFTFNFTTSLCKAMCVWNCQCKVLLTPSHSSLSLLFVSTLTDSVSSHVIPYALKKLKLAFLPSRDCKFPHLLPFTDIEILCSHQWLVTHYY